MSDNVVSLHGATMPSTATAVSVDGKLVEEIERILEAARAGEIVGFAASFLHRDKLASYSYCGYVSAFGMLGALDCLKDRLLRSIMASDR